jgi:hypothetical protein
MSVRIMYGRISILRSSVIVHMKVKKLVAGTLLPIGGHYCTHWEYLTSKAANPALVVSEWIRVEDADRDGRALWFIPDSLDLIFPLHACVGKARERNADNFNEEIVWSVFSADDQLVSSARLFYRTIWDLIRQTRSWGAPSWGVLCRPYVG